MKKLFVAFALSAGMFMLAQTASAQWLDTFDTYNLGPLAAQSDWEEWYTTPNVDADVSADFAFSGTKSVKIIGKPVTNDVVYPFVQLPGGSPTSGQWLFSSKVYVPTSSTGIGFLIMMSAYNDGSGTDFWSLQVRFNANSGMVKSDGAGAETCPLIKDKWINFRAYIDLDADKVDIFYNDVILVRGDSWQNGISTGGPARIDALDLYGHLGNNATTGTYFDNTSLAPADAYSATLNTFPNPAFQGNTISLTTMAPNLVNSDAALFVFDVNGIPVFRLIRVGKIDLGGKFVLSGPVPPGLAGLNINFLTLVVGPAGGTVETNKDLVQFK